MTIRSFTQVALAAVVGCLSVASAHAAPQVFFDVDLVSGNLPANGKSVAARTAFLATTSSSTTDSFEASPTGFVPSTDVGLRVLDGTAVLRPVGAATRGSVVQQSPNGNFGRFNTTAGCVLGTTCKWWETTQSFELTFDSEVSALGFYGTDFNDFKSTVTIDFILDTPEVPGVFGLNSSTVKGSATLPSVGSSGGVLFFGYVADTFKFNRVVFTIDQSKASNPRDPSTFDRLGFDDLTAGIYNGGPNPTPEPASLGLVALGLGLAALSRRRKTA